MRPERDRIEGLLGPISDGEAIDWDAVVRDADPSERAMAEALRDVDGIGSWSRALQRATVPDGGATETFREIPRWGELLLLERRGAGSSAEVWRAWDPRLRREVALKLVLSGRPGDTASADNSPLMAEGRALARVRHPNVVAVHGIDSHDGRVGLWMDLVRGDTLEQVVATTGPLAPDEAARLGREIGGAVEAVHAAGLLHRDIKPANVVRDADGRWILADFGLGRPLLAGGGADPAPLSLVGSPMYMPPELLEGGVPDARADVYALGLLVRYALTGAHPFPDGTLGELRKAAAAGPQPALAKARPGLPPGLITAVEMACAPRAAQRCASAREFVAALGTGAPPGRRGRRRAWLVAVPVLAVITIAALAAFNAGRGPGADARGTYTVEAALVRHGSVGPEPVVDGGLVSPGDRLSLRWRASRPLWVYVVNADDRGESYLLFPQPRFAARNPLPADTPVVLPGTMDGGEVAWTVTSAGGRETFLVIASPEPLAEFDGPVAGLAAPEPGRAIEYAAAPPAALERLRGVGGLSGVAPAVGGGEASPLARFRALGGREAGVAGVWVREITLRNPS